MATSTSEDVSISCQARGTSGVSRLLGDKLYEGAVSILDCRAADATSDSAAFGLAVATGKPVYLPAGKGSGKNGDYLISTASIVSGNSGKVGFLTAGTTVFGDGMGKTIIRPAAVGQTALCAMSSDAGTTIDNVTIRDLTLHGYSDTAFAEHAHLVALNGVRNPLIERVEFKAFQGDGIYFGTGEMPGSGRHNYNIIVRDCVFDGINNENRNAITIIDGDKVTITCNSFRNCTKSTMPGAIDFEPDDADTSVVLRDIEVSNNLFSAIGGTPAVIAFPIPSTVAALPRNIRILGNDFRDYAGSGAEIYINTGRPLTAADIDMAIEISGNRGENGVIPFDLRSLKGLVMGKTNVFQAYKKNAVVGLAAADKAIDCTIAPRMMLSGSEANGIGVRVGTVDGLVLGANLYKCGGTGAGGCPVQFAAGTASANVLVDGLRVVANIGQTIAIDNEGEAHGFKPATNRIIDSVLGGLASEFSATGPGQLLKGAEIWDPPSLLAGAGATSPAIRVAGASFGDTVQVGAPFDLLGIACSGYVSASNSVKIRLQNGTGGTLDLASGTWKVLVTKALA